MAYNPVAQIEQDALSDSDYSHISASPSNNHEAMAPHQSSSDLEVTSLRSRNISNASSVPLRHPTPDLQSLQGAYMGNIERLEQSAERLSMSSDIGEELRRLKLEQKRSESRRSSMMNRHVEEDGAAVPVARQFSYGQGSHTSNSLVDMNNIARAGGFSPTAYFASPRNSLRSGSWSQHNSTKGRSASQASRLTGVLEPERTATPLEFPGSGDFLPIIAPLKPLPKELRVANDEEISIEHGDTPRKLERTHHELPEHTGSISQRLATAASTDTTHQTNGLFEDFDGVHITAHPEDPLAPLNTARARTPSNPLLTSPRPRPKSYLDPRPKSEIELPPSEDMVYYPAPVPMILNLPQRLSKLPTASQRDKRRSEILGGLPVDARKSAAWLPNVLEGEDREVEHVDADRSPRKVPANRKSVADVPPQLRASVFFDYPAAQQDVELIGDSAVATLDSILDASAYAPVSAFTDHPIVGRVGPEVYGRILPSTRDSMMPLDRPGQKRRSSLNLLRRNSSSNLLDDTKKRNSSLLSLGNFGKRKSSAPELDMPDLQNEADAASMHVKDTPLQGEHEEETHDERGELPDDDPEFHDAQENFDADLDNLTSAPTTLLAELQLRKQQLKTRTRTAATAYPNGMHSTLLELDAVAQVEKQSRQQKHINLAWETSGTQHPGGAGNEDDEDVPLGVLFPNRKINSRARYDEDRPLGLIARRHMEDNEPLSRRRARLRGEEALPREAELARRMSAYTLDLPGFAPEGPPSSTPEIIPDVEGETLGQRLKRLKSATSPSAVQASRPISGDFASEVLSQLGVPTRPTELPPANPEEETLGQRRKRLQAERDGAAATAGGTVADANTDNSPAKRPDLSSRRTSMADLLQVHPAAGASRNVSREEVPQLLKTRTRNTAWAMDVNKRASSGNLALIAGFGAPPGPNGFGGAGTPGVAPGIMAGSVMNGYAMGGVGTRMGMNGGMMNGSNGPVAQGGGGRVVPHPMVSGGFQVGGMEKGQRDMIERWRTSVMH